jgi:hypothetical protein
LREEVGTYLGDFLRTDIGAAERLHLYDAANTQAIALMELTVKHAAYFDGVAWEQAIRRRVESHKYHTSAQRHWRHANLRVDDEGCWELVVSERWTTCIAPEYQRSNFADLLSQGEGVMVTHRYTENTAVFASFELLWNTIHFFAENSHASIPAERYVKAGLSHLHAVRDGNSVRPE